MIDITPCFKGKCRYQICPDCGSPSIKLYDDFCWVCQACGFEEMDNPGDYLTPSELTDWKCGMWTPNLDKKTSLLIGWQLMEGGKEISSGVIPFDTEDGSLKMWLALYLIRAGQLVGRELRFQLFDARDGE